ncbi:Fpg/Nei family DNA glycosylase [Shimia ponticola]|uniref:Fpg/Nei family DNA glycosylase n=1 Tax=Shimia ponticola TaxID=2582893 RepID=UPI0011BE97CD|nr:DNA-formamidopyrimidine glycosylase family protein [Shimia ponticola]
MPEGHTIHRAARDHADVLQGKTIAAISPQGRFAAQAEQINGTVLTSTGAIGKHLFYHFSNGLTVHIHLGLGGYFVLQTQPADPPRDVVRLRMEGPTHVLDIIGPNTCELIPTHDVETLRLRYGPDLLADPPDPDRAIARIRRSRAPIAKLLMDQKVMSGIGNIYRAEILWLRRIDPMTQGCDLTEATLRALWDEMRELLKLGVELNAIVTNGERPKPGEPITERTNIFASDTCPECAGGIEKSTLAGRTLYHCPVCQTQST